METASPPQTSDSPNPLGPLHTATPKSPSKMFPYNLQSSNGYDQRDTPMELASPPQTFNSQNSSEPLHTTTPKSHAKMFPSDKGVAGQFAYGDRP